MHQSKPQIAQYSQMKQNLQLKTKQHIAGKFPTIMIHTRNLWNYIYVKYLHAVFNAIYLISCGHNSAAKIIRGILHDESRQRRAWTQIHWSSFIYNLQLCSVLCYFCRKNIGHIMYMCLTIRSISAMRMTRVLTEILRVDFNIHH